MKRDINMKLKKDRYNFQSKINIDLHDIASGSIDYGGILVASLCGLIIILIGALTTNVDFISSYIER